jgi:ABC-type phosphate transport system substrate-binding protein
MQGRRHGGGRLDRGTRRLRLAALLCALLAPRPLPAGDVALTVIVHPRHAGALSRADVRAIYLKQKALWPDGEAIVPINRESGSDGRERFSRAVFGQDSRRMAEYWNRRYFDAGEFPPATLASDDAVIRFVARTPNAIGYVLTREPGDAVAVALELD